MKQKDWKLLSTGPTRPGWPPRLLAKDGFYYLRIGDTCACIFCGGLIGKWKKGDTPRGEHSKHFGDCVFILRKESSGNVPLGLNVKPIETDSWIVEHKSAKEKRKYTQLKYYAMSYDERVETFNNPNWPKKLNQTPSRLAEAGFFYTGWCDGVMCTFCGCKLRNWLAEADPWEEHARWSGKCAFAKFFYRKLQNTEKTKYIGFVNAFTIRILCRG